ncbi:autotransporter outer membrane beta-barrel domain-containing protein [Roseomonas hellenica]|uniref:Autotransporter outer membrane beta-barrel domain-containing protein n=1 Tax=Plastoroseomonas hellenica TaxID=2687306 RepID=A0ABS5F5A0_9PROT|nr:autotransporter outer membrane beta-barrel domain-containing protein [Plastoroseomonas hellenica]MBR0667758.1 autotransporter outer membrane beta-barrel domain-containing protein [Plastoroseomonas hellenica]
MRPGPWRAARPWLLASAAAVAVLAAVSRPALAVDCDPVPVAGTATCSAGSPPQPGGEITYNSAVPMTLVLDGTTQGPLIIEALTPIGPPTGAITLVTGSAAGPSQIITTGTVDINVAGYQSALFISGSAGADVGITVASGTTITSSFSYGAYATTDGGGSATVTLTGGSIRTTGTGSQGAFAESAGGAATVTVTGSITTQGLGAVGAVASGTTGATVTLIGAGIATTGQNSYGGYATLHGAGLATVSIDAASTIATQGFGAHGAYALVDAGTGSALVVNAGGVATTGLGAAGLYASVLASSAEIRNTGSITTAGSGAPGILAVANGAVTILSSGSIVTSGASGIGAFAASLAAASATASITVSGSILTGNAGAAAGAYGAYASLNGASSGLASVTLLGGGSIATTGLGGIAAFADSPSGGDAEVRNAGTITTQGEEGRGAFARVFLGTGNALVVNAGSVATAGAEAHGLVASVESGAIGSATIVNSGSIATSGVGAHGILVEASGAATITSSGSITASGAAASGIHIRTAAGGYSIAVTGGTITGGSSFDATLGTGAGISIGGGASGTIDIAAGATVQAASGVAIQDGAGALALTSSGSILGSIAAGGGNDQVTLAGGSVTQGLADGGLGTDRITLAGARFIGSFAGWESLGITQGSHATLNGDIVMGDSATLTGPVTIDATSTLAAPGNRTIRAFDAASLVTVTNAGLIAIASGGMAGNTLTIAGNYVGQGGTIALNTMLAGDGSASDRLVISGGRASGDTALRITNVGGAGAPTVQGIRVVETTNGGTTDAGAFRLNTRVTAGAFEYQLFRGGSTSAEDWYLRSFLIPEEPGTPDQPGPAIPLYRPEVSLYAPVAAVARQMGLATLATLRDRRGEEEGIGDGAIVAKATSPYASGAWARVIGERSRSRWDGTVDARATGNLIGLQAGFDILQTQPYAGGHRDILGVYVAYTDFNAPNVSGFALGQRNLRVGRLLMSGPAVGAYWTHFGPSGWYVDAVFQANWFDVTARSDFGAGLSTNGVGYTASLEAGYPIRLAPRWQIEPSAQLVWQGVSVDRARDQFSTVDWDEGDAVTGRIGARLQYTGRDARTLWQPYAKLNLWHAFSGNDRVSFGSGAPIENRFGETALEVGAGVTARVTEAASFYAHADYRWSVAGDSRQTAVQGSIGIRVTW